MTVMNHAVRVSSGLIGKGLYRLGLESIAGCPFGLDSRRRTHQRCKREHQHNNTADHAEFRTSPIAIWSVSTSRIVYGNT